MDGRDRNGLPLPSNSIHVPPSSGQLFPQMNVTAQASPACNGSANNTTRNESLQKFISDVRDDAALCCMIKQRRTRWVEEEDEYANFLVQEFELGIARDVADQSTLRAYLSRKLICTPMRISKKYVGKKVGNILYKSKVMSYGISEISRQTHLELEHKCLNALVGQVKRANEAEKKAAKAKAKSKLSKSSKAETQPKPTQEVQGQMPLPMLPQQTVQHMERQARSEFHQNHQHQYNTGAMQHNQVISYQQGFPTSHQQSNYALIHNTYKAGVYPTGVYNHNFHGANLGNHKANPQHTYATGFSVPIQCSRPASFQAEQTPRAQCTAQGHATSIIGANSTVLTTPTNPTASCSNGSMLDLVSGFDKHAATLSTNQDITTILESRPCSTTWPKNSHFFSGGVEESPYITSKSFDELHKCLGGVDMPSEPSDLDLNKTDTGTQNSSSQPVLSTESPYVTSKSFDDMHRCLGNGLPSLDAMSHVDLGANSAKSGNSHDNDSTESSSAYGESNPGVDIDTEHREVVDPRSDKFLSAFSPFDGSRVMQDQETAPCQFDTMMRRVSAPPLQVHQVIESYTGRQLNPRCGFEHLDLSQSSNMRYATSSQLGLTTFLKNRDTQAYPHPVSTSTSEQSSDRGNSSPDCAEVQSD